VLKEDHLRTGRNFLEFGFEPLELLGFLAGRALGVLDEAGVKNDAEEIAMAEGIGIGSELVAIGGERFGGRLIADVMISGDAIELESCAEMRLYSAICAALPAWLTRSPQTMTNAGLRRLASAIAFS